MSFEVGEKVRVRKGLKTGELYGNSGVNKKMETLAGEIVTIKQSLGYKVEGSCWRWTDEMLEKVEEEEPKFKVEDTVRIRKDLKVGEKYGSTIVIFVKEMDKYKGMIATIQENKVDDLNRLSVDNGKFIWTDEMLEKVEEEEPKFKAGEKVRVRKGLKMECSKTGVAISHAMRKLSGAGSVLTIKCCTTEEYGNTYNVNENSWLWTDEMLEKVEEEKMEKQYKLWEILKMVDEGRLSKEDWVVNCKGFKVQIKNTSLQYEPFTMPQKTYTFTEVLSIDKRIRCEHDKWSLAANKEKIEGNITDVNAYFSLDNFLKIIGIRLFSSDIRKLLREGKFYIEGE